MVFPAEQQRLLPAHHMETVDFICMHSKLLRFGVSMLLSCQIAASSPFTLSEQDVARWTHLGMGCTSPT